MNVIGDEIFHLSLYSRSSFGEAIGDALYPCVKKNEQQICILIIILINTSSIITLGLIRTVVVLHQTERYMHLMCE